MHDAPCVGQLVIQPLAFVIVTAVDVACVRMLRIREHE
jgi:hypothetical protein